MSANIIRPYHSRQMHAISYLFPRHATNSPSLLVYLLSIYQILFMYFKSINYILLRKQLKFLKNLEGLRDLPLQAFDCKNNLKEVENEKHSIPL